MSGIFSIWIWSIFIKYNYSFIVFLFYVVNVFLINFIERKFVLLVYMMEKRVVINNILSFVVFVYFKCVIIVFFLNSICKIRFLCCLYEIIWIKYWVGMIIEFIGEYFGLIFIYVIWCSKKVLEEKLWINNNDIIINFDSWFCI